MSKKQTVILDLDSTLNDLHHHMYEAFKTSFNLDKPHHLWTSYHLCETYQVPFDEVLFLIDKYDLLQLCQPLPGAKELISFLKTHFEVGIITARKCFENSEMKTKNWLEQHELLPDWTEISGITEHKHEVISNKVGQCFLFLDDSPANLLGVLESGTARHVATLKYAWTKKLPSDILQFDSLAEIKDFLIQELNTEAS